MLHRIENAAYFLLTCSRHVKLVFPVGWCLDNNGGFDCLPLPPPAPEQRPAAPPRRLSYLGVCSRDVVSNASQVPHCAMLDATSYRAIGHKRLQLSIFWQYTGMERWARLQASHAVTLCHLQSKPEALPAGMAAALDTAPVAAPPSLVITSCAICSRSAPWSS